MGVANSILIKVNQIGTLTETHEARIEEAVGDRAKFPGASVFER